MYLQYCGWCYYECMCICKILETVQLCEICPHTSLCDYDVCDCVNLNVEVWYCVNFSDEVWNFVNLSVKVSNCVNVITMYVIV